MKRCLNSLGSELGLPCLWSGNVDCYLMWIYLGRSMSGHCKGLLPSRAITTGSCGKSLLQDTYPTASSKGTGLELGWGHWPGPAWKPVISCQDCGDGAVPSSDKNHVCELESESTGHMTRARYVVVTELIQGLSTTDNLKAWPNPK